LCQEIADFRISAGYFDSPAGFRGAKPLIYKGIFTPLRVTPALFAYSSQGKEKKEIEEKYFFRVPGVYRPEPHDPPATPSETQANAGTFRASTTRVNSSLTPAR